MTRRRVPCINPTGQKPRRADPAVVWQVPQDMRVALPAGMAYQSSGRMVILRPGRPGHVLRTEDWGQEAASQIAAVLLISAFHGSYLIEGGYPSGGRVYTRKPLVVPLRAGQRLTVGASGDMTGELWAFPLRYLAGPVSSVPGHD